MLSKHQFKCMATAVFSLIVALSITLGFFETSEKTVQAEESTAKAYFVTEDRETHGLWYNGENGGKDNPQADRNYGKDGAIIPYHWLRANGQSITDVSILNDFSENTEYYYDATTWANYSEYPSYVSSVVGNIQSYSDMPEGYWMNTPRSYEDFFKSISVNEANKNTTLPINLDEVRESGKNTVIHGGYCSTDDIMFKTTITDDAWHLVSAFIGRPYSTYLGNEVADAMILDEEDNIVARRRVLDYHRGVYVTFAVKGTFTLLLRGVGSKIWFSAMYFDDYTENTEIGISNVTKELEGARTINLNWTNQSQNSYTNIYRRLEGESLWSLHDRVGEGISSYTDTDTTVSTSYEYLLTSGIKKVTAPSFYPLECTPDLKYFNIPNESSVIKIATAPYLKTQIEFTNDTDSFFSVVADEPLTVEAVLKKWNPQTEEFIPYEGIEVTLSLGGDNVYTQIAGVDVPNMDVVFGKQITDSEGKVSITSSVPYAGEYTIIASIEMQPDLSDPTGLSGYDSCKTETILSVLGVDFGNPSTPFLTSISDAIQPGQTMTITGYNLSNDGQLSIAYAPNAGTMPAEFDSDKGGIKYLSANDMIVTDAENGMGLMFTFPSNESAGIYDFWVKNAKGWSNGITLNAVRPLFISQEASYQGQQVQIVGRNFFQSEYGIGTDETSLNSIRVRLKRIGDTEGNLDSITDYSLTLRKGFGLLTGIKATKEESATGEAIPYSNPYKLTIEIPVVQYTGTYEVLVASDGRDFRSLQEPQTLVILNKKPQNWDETVFGEYGANHIGNDPLDLGVYWAQDLNYTNIKTMTPNQKPSPNFMESGTSSDESVNALTRQINDAIKALGESGGGVVYFPEGEYYFGSVNLLYNNVILVGDKNGKTNFYYSSGVNSAWIRATGGTQRAYSNIGVARINFKHCEYSSSYVALVLGFGESSPDSAQESVAGWLSENKFVVDCTFDFFKEYSDEGSIINSTSARNMAYTLQGHKNLLAKNVIVDGGAGGMAMLRGWKFASAWNVRVVPATANEEKGLSAGTPHIHAKYSIVENCHFDINFGGHGLSVRSDTYVGFIVSSRAGLRVNRTNDGEVLLVEVVYGYFSTGKVLAATKRSITLDYASGEALNDTTRLQYNQYAVYIVSGTGAGQVRYIDRTMQGAYGITFNLLEGEKDWDIVPDNTSVFSLILPNKNLTVYKLVGIDCVAALTLYYNAFDAVVSDCTLRDTGGISVWGASSGGITGGRACPSANVRIQNNDISGVGNSFNVGSSAAQGQAGGILLISQYSGGYMGYFLTNITIRNNYIHDTIPDYEYDYSDVDAIKTLGGSAINLLAGSKSGAVGSTTRFVIIEDNVIENTLTGLNIQRSVFGVVVKNLSISNTFLKEQTFVIDNALATYSYGTHSLFVGANDSGLSGEYLEGEELPKIAGTDGKTFFGWTKSPDFEKGMEVITQAYGYNIKLYAQFGYKVDFDFNYKKQDGSAMGIIESTVVMDGTTYLEVIREIYEPFRLGYDFGGWYTDADCTVKADDNTVISKQTTLYAKWISDEQKNDDTEEPTGCGSTADASMYTPFVLLFCLTLLFIRNKKGAKRKKARLKH